MEVETLGFMTTKKEKILALVTARGGSKGVPHKNIKPLAGASLIARCGALISALPLIDRSMISTDCKEIAAEAEKFGIEVPFIRPTNLATDTSPILDSIKHAVRWAIDNGWEPDIVCLLQPTSPLRKVVTVKNCLTTLIENPHATSVVTVSPVPEHYLPHCVMKISEGRLDYFLEDGPKYPNRQEAPKAFVRNGVSYVFRTKTLLESGTIYGSHCIPIVTSDEESISIDTESDWEQARAILENK